MERIVLETIISNESIVQDENFNKFHMIVNSRLESLLKDEGYSKKFGEGNTNEYLIYNKDNILTKIFTTSITLTENSIKYVVGSVIDVI